MAGNTPTHIGTGDDFEDLAPLTPEQQRTVDQLVAAGAEELPMAVRPGSDPSALAPNDVSIDSGGLVRVGPYSDDPIAEYQARLDRREEAALDVEAEAIYEEESLLAKAAGAAGDVSKGVVLEGLPAIAGGAKDAVNETLDFIEAVADQIPGGVVTWGPDGVELMSGKEAKERGFAERYLPRLSGDTEEQLETNTGRFIESASQFVTGFLGAGKLLKGWAAAGRAGTLVKGMVQGAIADFTVFDPHEERLSNMLAEIAPEQAKPIFEYLAAKQEDSELAGRAKNALEGLGLGLAAESVFQGLRYIRAGRQAKEAARREAAAQGFQVDPAIDAAKEAQQSAEVVAEARKMLRPSFQAKVDAAAETTGKMGKDAPKQITGATVEPNVFDIDFNKLDTPEKVRATIASMAEKHADQIDEARGGVQSWATTREKAEGIDWVSSMAARRPGQALNAAEITAYREAMNASATRLVQLADEVQVRPTIATQFAFRRMLATHHAIQLEFMGARAEAGRALQAFQMPVGAPERALRQIDALLAESGGAATVDELAKKVLRAAKNGDVALGEVIRTGAFARSRAMVKALYTNGLLSGLGTPVVNVLGNTLALMMNVSARATSPRLAHAFDDVSDTETGEALALMSGYVGALRDAFRLSARETVEQLSFDKARQQGALRSLAPGLDGMLPAGVVKTGREETGGMGFADAVEQRPFSSAAWRVEEDSNFGRALDVLQMVIETPSNANMLMDDFFRVVAARGELRAQAFRQAQRDVRAGIIEPEEAGGRIQALLDNPTPAMLDAAEREMRELTFTRADGEVELKINAFRRTLDSRGPFPVGTLLMPFVRTPANIMSMALRYSPLAPMMARYTKAIQAGGAEAEIARAKWAVGTAMYAVLMDMALNGEITGGGPGNSQQRDAMVREDPSGAVSWQPYSVRVGNSWVSYERADPLGTSMSLAADLSEIVANDDWDGARDEQTGEIAGHVIGAMGEAFFDKTMLSSAFETVEAVSSGDAARAETMLKGRAASVIPFSSAMRMARRGSDEYLRETSGVVDAMRNTVPVLSEGLPPQYDLWGNPRTYQSGLGRVYDAVTPVRVKPAGGNAIDFEILENGVSVAMPAKSMTIEGERVSLKNRPDIYSDYVALAGQPAFEHLEAVATGNHPDSAFYYSLSDGPDGEKAEYILDVIEDYRKLAREQILEIHGEDLAAMAASTRRRREEARLEE